MTYGPAFKCDTCDYFSADEDEMKAHAAVPVTGLELQIGQIFGIDDKMDPFTSGGTIGDRCFHFPIAVVLGGPEINEAHQRIYSLAAYQIYKHPSGYSITDVDVHYNVAESHQVNFQNEFRELSGEEYALVLDMLQNHTLPPNFTHTMARNIKNKAGEIEFSQGKLPVKVETAE